MYVFELKLYPIADSGSRYTVSVGPWEPRVICVHAIGVTPGHFIIASDKLLYLTHACVSRKSGAERSSTYGYCPLRL